MSKAENKVKWCLDKVKKDMRANHRGLVEIEPDIEEAKKHIIKAEHNFKAAISFEKTGFSDWSVSAVFYTIYHCFLGIIIKFGYESRNQECTIALIQYLKDQGKINISNELIATLKSVNHEEKHQSNIVELRENFQYGTETSVEDKYLLELKDLCKKAIEETKKIIY
tara:strand:- start:62 stop:562 length:501 start_codon:yes stop_codon:yes gene_type:complete